MAEVAVVPLLCVAEVTEGRPPIRTKDGLAMCSFSVATMRSSVNLYWQAGTCFLLIVESAKDVRLLTRIQKTNKVNLILPIMSGV